MAEIRKHDPEAGDGLGKLVRDALGERIRPIEPGSRRDQDQATEDDVPEEPRAASMPSWPSDGPAFEF